MNKQFENWIDSHYTHDGIDTAKEWEKSFPISMQWGVYLEFFDSVGMTIYLDYFAPREQWHVVIVEPNKKGTHDCYNVIANSICDGIPVMESRQEAQKEAIKKAFEILEK